jgi:hypothetical protein
MIIDEVAARRFEETPASALGAPRFAESRALRCRRCGYVAAVSVGHPDEVLLRASCCPRCDGRLVAADAGSEPRDPAPATALYPANAH